MCPGVAKSAGRRWDLSNDIILTGIPRSGTTLTCHLLNKVPNTVALHEPLLWDAVRDPTDHRTVCDGIDHFFRQTRESCLASGTAITKHARGAVPDNPMGNYPRHAAAVRLLSRLLPGADRLVAWGLRRPRVTRGAVRIGKPLAPGFSLCIKHTAPFTALLPELLRRHPCYAVVRDPVSVLASWSSIHFALRDGRNMEAERMHPELAHRLAAMPDRIDRQIHLLSWFCRAYLAWLPPDRILRYEDIIRTRGKSLSAVIPEAASLDEPLESRNKNGLYDRELMGRIATRLEASDGPIWDLYRKDSIHEYIG